MHAWPRSRGGDLVRPRELGALPGALAGSTIRMIDAVRHMVQDAGATLPEAVRMATWNPARALAFDRRRGWNPLWGSLSAGAPADLVLISEALEVRSTYVGGECVFAS